ncbi:hypothetical protein B0J15DRAFT_473245 [Fusarium solani]|uniref:Uncharacterized protein n=1 Tax=Fusarium solani TaxID=169388 RepID=A0A9P9FZS6_FUSSL|nr:uncharacterized protein B0J15DRAFT_473245 [Fusarium solani]KAH7228618.1 hypothetical protein B0J15DRAFT_473245 [Fusarium solani]
MLKRTWTGQKSTWGVNAVTSVLGTRPVTQGHGVHLMQKAKGIRTQYPSETLRRTLLGSVLHGLWRPSNERLLPSCDNSPKLFPEHERDLPKVLIESVYHLTKLTTLGSPDFIEDTQINNFSRQLDQCVGPWTSTFPDHQENFGTCPRKGALFHLQFAKPYLFFHIFRGLGNSEISIAFMDAAHGATTCYDD